MYSSQKPFRDQNHKPKRSSHKNTPSFSSSLLDEICRSFDGGPAAKTRAILAGDEQSPARFTVDELKKTTKSVAKPRKPSLENLSFHDNEFMFFSSNLSSSDSSGGLSSSDTEFLACRTKSSRSKVSCFSTKPKPVRTGRGEENRKNAIVDDEDLATSKSRALNFYSNLKKVKQPISPGAKLTNFINSIFSSSYKSKNGKKSKPKVDTNNGFDCCVDRDSKTSSSLSSSSGSCLIKNSSRSGDAVRPDVSRKPPLPPTAKIVVKGYQNCEFWTKIRDEDEDEDEDVASDSSSDLFELDNLSLFENNHRFCEELPVYETTNYFDKNCSLIR